MAESDLDSGVSRNRERLDRERLHGSADIRRSKRSTLTNESRLQSATRRTPISIIDIAVIALYFRGSNPISTNLLAFLSIRYCDLAEGVALNALIDRPIL